MSLISSMRKFLIPVGMIIKRVMQRVMVKRMIKRVTIKRVIIDSDEENDCQESVSINVLLL